MWAWELDLGSDAACVSGQPTLGGLSLLHPPLPLPLVPIDSVLSYAKPFLPSPVSALLDEKEEAFWAR